MSHKTDMRKCDKNVSNKTYAKSKNHLSKVKELDQLVLQKVAPLLDKRGLGQSQRTSGG